LLVITCIELHRMGACAMATANSDLYFEQISIVVFTNPAQSRSAPRSG
jgi:hypothetical protein